jgi:hypothetical protein
MRAAAPALFNFAFYILHLKQIQRRGHIANKTTRAIKTASATGHVNAKPNLQSWPKLRLASNDGSAAVEGDEATLPL